MAWVVSTPEQVREYMAKWRLSEDMYEKAKQWHEKLVNQTYIATTIQVPFTLDGRKGMLLADSTPQSTEVSKQNNHINNMLGIVTDPHWLYYKLWWHPGRAALNWSGIRDAKYEGSALPILLGELLERACIAKGMPDWRDRFCRIDHGFFRSSLRQLFVSLDIHNWIEITAGISWREYAVLDLYISVFSGGMEPPEEEAWYLLNTDVWPQYRHQPKPEDWYRYKNWQSYGQRACTSEWFVRDCRILQRMSASSGDRMELVRRMASNPTTQWRILNLLRHLSPGGGPGDAPSRM